MGLTDRILLAHGSGGRQSQDLLQQLIIPLFKDILLTPLDDSACLSLPAGQTAFTTDSYVVDPLFFPGGDIGRLAACGTINDLVMQGGKPLFLSLGLIIEEGLPTTDLQRILESLAAVLQDNEVRLATGDTKVVQRGQANGLYINTAGIGRCLPGVDTSSSNARPGDEVIVTGTIGDHGVAVLSHRQGVRFETELTSDVAPLWALLKPVFEHHPAALHVLRDPTRGGVAAAVCDIARASNVGVVLNERSLPIRAEVRGACSLFGLDPLDVANEGKALVVCNPKETPTLLEALRSHPLGQQAAVIGSVVAESPGLVRLRTRAGGERLVDLPAGELLPRIC
ncbi:MAG: hydrogenase expression/formation protein HypE [candidate division FCPU426 bacterium]